jgi:hypothetical protein
MAASYAFASGGKTASFISHRHFITDIIAGQMNFHRFIAVLCEFYADRSKLPQSSPWPQVLSFLMKIRRIYDKINCL